VNALGERRLDRTAHQRLQKFVFELFALVQVLDRHRQKISARLVREETRERADFKTQKSIVSTRTPYDGAATKHSSTRKS